MVLEAAADFQIDLAASFFVGDKAFDIECGRRAGTRTILVRTGYGAALEGDPDFKAPDFVANDAPARPFAGYCSSNGARVSRPDGSTHWMRIGSAQVPRKRNFWA